MNFKAHAPASREGTTLNLQPNTHNHHVGLAQLVCGASLKPEVVGSIPGVSNYFLKRFCFTVEKNYVVIAKNYGESKLLRNS
jgi:hypothetical protein